jgi:hypothetical protein
MQGESWNMKKISLSSKNRWRVITGDESNWRIGMYSPEYTSEKKVDKLEKHTCVELFMLLEGKMSLLLRNDKGRERVVELEQGFVYMVDEYHNGFRPRGAKGRALVIERDTFSTTYIDRTGKVISKVRVVKGKDVKK